MIEGQHKDIICKNCNNVVSIDTKDIRKRLDNIFADIQKETHGKVKFFGTLTLFDLCIECCDKPDYYGRE